MNDIEKELFDFYQTFLMRPEMDCYQKLVIDRVLDCNPKTVIDFGCNSGEVMEYLINKAKYSFDVQGYDISKAGIKEALKKGLNVHWGGYSIMCLRHNKVDVIYTCSVLSHVPDSSILLNFQEMVNKRIVLAETQEVKGKYYFPHNYQSWGFTKIGECSNKFNVKYDIWEWNK